MDRREQSNNKTIIQATRAQELAQDLGLFRFIDEERQRAINALLETSGSDQAGIESHRMYAKALDRVKQTVNSFLISGKISQHDMKDVKRTSDNEKG